MFLQSSVVLKTFLDHAKRKSKRLKNWQTGSQAPEDAATEDLFYDECVATTLLCRTPHGYAYCRGFHIVQAFLAFATHNTVESLQSLSVTRMPFVSYVSDDWSVLIPAYPPHTGQPYRPSIYPSPRATKRRIS
jgi:hypothetical protein